MSNSEHNPTRALPKLANFYDFLKHTTTLATASIVLLATFAEKFQKAVTGRFLIPIGIVCFLAAALSAIICMFFALSCQRYDDDEIPHWEQVVVFVTLLTTGTALFLGLAVIGIFVALNI